MMSVSISCPAFPLDSLSSNNLALLFVFASRCQTSVSHVFCPCELLYPACIRMACHPLFPACTCRVGGRPTKWIYSFGLESRVQQRRIFQQNHGLRRVSRINENLHSVVSHLVLECSSSCGFLHLVPWRIEPVPALRVPHHVSL